MWNTEKYVHTFIWETGDIYLCMIYPDCGIRYTIRLYYSCMCVCLWGRWIRLGCVCYVYEYVANMMKVEANQIGEMVAERPTNQNDRLQTTRLARISPRIYSKFGFIAICVLIWIWTLFDIFLLNYIRFFFQHKNSIWLISLFIFKLAT